MVLHDTNSMKFEVHDPHVRSVTFQEIEVRLLISIKNIKTRDSAPLLTVIHSTM